MGTNSRFRAQTETFFRDFARLLVTFAFIFVFIPIFIACQEAPRSGEKNIKPNTTGFRETSGRGHTGAAKDDALDKIKNEIGGDAQNVESLSKEDRDLATRILGAHLEKVTLPQGLSALRVHISVRDLGRLQFDFTDKDIAKKASDSESRYKSVIGTAGSGEQSIYEAALLCRQQAEATSNTKCAVATIALRERHGSRAKAGLIVRHQDVLVLARSTGPDSIKHEGLRRIANAFKSSQHGMLQSFEVAWGPSGFNLDLHEAQSLNDLNFCPSGRLVETNDFDEPLKLNCDGSEPSRDLEGRLIGNTTQGELFLEIAGTRTGIFNETTERIYILVRQKKAPKAGAQPKPSTSPKPGSTPSTPGTGATPEPAAPAANTTDDAEEEEDDFFLDERAEEPAAAPGISTPTTAGWLIPIDLTDRVTKSFAKDRKHAVVDAKVKSWKTSKRFLAFAARYLPNRDTVLAGLKKHRVPGEFSFLTLIESTFFIEDEYPIQVSSRGAVGPWQFMYGTGGDPRFGLKVYPVTTVVDEKTKKKTVTANVCDERADLAKSSEAAGKYLRVLLDMFPKDPKLAVMAYNWGEGNVDCLQKASKKCDAYNKKRGYTKDRLDDIRELGLSYWAIRRFNMAPSSTLDYVVNFVSAHHAALELEPLKGGKQIEPWKPVSASQCTK